MQYFFYTAYWSHTYRTPTYSNVLQHANPKMQWPCLCRAYVSTCKLWEFWFFRDRSVGVDNIGNERGICSMRATTTYMY